MDSIIRLFNAVLVKNKVRAQIPPGILKSTIRNGFILSEEIVANYSQVELNKVISKIEKIVGFSGEKANSSFHKSWKKIKDSTIEQLLLEQIVHYITTYGFESLGIYDQNTIYIPEEVLNIPKLGKIEKLSLVCIKGYTIEEIKEKLFDMLKSGIALKESTMKDVLDVATFLKFDPKDIDIVKNREVKIALLDYLGIVPEDPIELLRYMIFKATNKTLLIKDKKTIAAIKARNNIDVLGILNRYSKKYSLDRMAEIFFRFKPLFLAFKTSTQLNTVINKIRKLADEHHKPMPEDYLNSVTKKVKNNSIVLKQLNEELKKVNTFRKIRLAYALKYRTFDADSILYKIRNGKGYATDFFFENKEKAERVLKDVTKSIAKDINPNVSGKKIYVPNNIEYALPATEKQFTGMFPSGTCVTLAKDMVLGVYWENVNHHRIDLDLSLNAIGGEKFGWDGYYRSGNSSILFSGDMTDAHNGASELFYIKNKQEGSYALVLNYFNYYEDAPVPFKTLVAYEQPKDFRSHYMVNPNNIIAVTDAVLDQKQRVLGILIIDAINIKFYFSETNMGNSITSRRTGWSDNVHKYMLDYHQNMINFNDILLETDAEFVSKPEESDIDLSPGKLEKDTFIKLLQK